MCAFIRKITALTNWTFPLKTREWNAKASRLKMTFGSALMLHFWMARMWAADRSLAQVRSCGEKFLLIRLPWVRRHGLCVRGHKAFWRKFDRALSVVVRPCQKEDGTKR